MSTSQIARVALALLGSLLVQATSTASDRPNIVLIMADDLGFECIGANGGESYRTPVLDQLAQQGMRFEHCYSQPICTPSRVKLMTGIYNVRNYAVFGLLEQNQRTFAHLFRDAGYSTCIVGKWQLGRDATLPNHFGFDEHCLWQLFRTPSRYASPGLEINGEARNFPGGYGPDLCADYACEFIEKNKDKPFLLYYPMIITHCPFEPTPDSVDWDPTSKGSKTYKGDPKYFGDMVTYMDKIVGKILDQLSASGVRDNTLVIFTGDNGTDTPIVSQCRGVSVAGAKGKTIDAGCHVPLIVDWPGQVDAGSECMDMIDFSDFLPTICDASGVSLPDQLQLDGRSFLPQIRGKEGDPRSWIYVWYARNGGPEGAEFARNQQYKLYRNGKFFDVPADPLEKNPLQLESLSQEAKVAHELLNSALDKYSDARPDRFAQWKELHKKKNKKSKSKSNQ